MQEFIDFMGAVGIPIGGGLGMAFFLWLVLRQILQSQIDEIETLTMFCESLENRARTMSNDMIKIDCMVSDMLKLRPDTDRIARAENFIEDGKLDVRRD